MKFQLKYKLCLWKSYLDKGLNLTNYLKYLIAFFALASSDVKSTFIIGVVYAIGCFFLGRWWFRSDFIKAEFEVGNRYNLFVEEMRETFKRNKKHR